MAARHLVVLACFTLLIPFTTNAEFLNEEDLVFEESASPPRWRTVNHKRTVNNEQVNSLNSPLLQHHSSSGSEDGLWNSAVKNIQRFKRGFFDFFDPTSKETTDETSTSWTTLVKEVSNTDPETTSEPNTSNTLFRDTRSTDDVEEFNRTKNEYLSSLRDDDDDFNIDGISGSGTPPDTPNEITPSTTEYTIPPILVPNQIVYHRATIAVQEPYKQEYADRNSEDFKEFSENFSKTLDNSLESIPGTQKSGVINIEKSDNDRFVSIVTLDISSEGYNNPEEIKNLLQERIEKYHSIGAYSLMSENFKFTDFGARVEPFYPPADPCGPGDIRCTTVTGESCLSIEARCNGTEECIDGWDEAGCPSTTTDCADGQFLCDITRCIPQNEVCDGVAQCRDESDEDNCPERACDSEREFECEDKTCIPIRMRCDGELDCIGSGSDERNCSTTPQCKSDDFTCGNTNCIKLYQRCDGFNDCQDGTDELNCNDACSPDQFKCTSGNCISAYLRCDRNRDCPDGSDEEKCETICTPEQFRCNDGYCLPLSVLCNGVPECREGEDERNCPSPLCQPYEIQCRDRSGCYRESQKCDSYPDCGDSSDEEDCGSPVHCMTNEFRCNDGSCIQLAYKCDNVTDCPDRSDELNCRLQACGAKEITCGDGTCVPQALACDGTRDCRDGADERNCPPRCRSDEFPCDGGRCVSFSKRCDRMYDCLDRIDEENCGYSCRSDEFTCGDGSCIPQSRRCDGRSVDCRDGADERNCSGSEGTDAPVRPVSCTSSQFACQSGDQCVPISAHCDTLYDCRDYSDESNCAGPPDGLNLKTYPPDQIIKESREVVFQCRDEGPLRASVRWTRGNGLPLPPGSRDIKGRLEMPNIQLEHTGNYVCEATGFSSSTPGSRASVYLNVEPFEQQPYPTKAACAFNEATCSNGECIAKSRVCDGQYDCEDRSDELRCNPHGCEPNEFRCDNKKCVQKTWRCDSDDDCGDGSDERNCQPSPPGSKCRYNEYQCSKYDQCIPKAFHCDMEMDCQDGTDETGCRKSEIHKPPPSMIVKQPGESFTITCTAVGVPTPEVVWRLNWGHIPSKCRTTSDDGYGTLTCPNIQESDQGAYSCEALNNQGSVFAIPDTILVVKANRTVCPQGTFNELATSYDECIPCFCFGITTSCRSANLFIYQLPPPLDIFRVVNVDILPGGGLEVRRGESSQFQTSVHPIGRSGFQISLTDNELKSSYYNPVYPYFALPENYLGNQLKSYGGYLKYTVKSDGTGTSLSIPDVILTGNGLTLVYKGAPINPREENNIGVRFFPGNWYKVQSDTRREYPTSRQDLMMALQQVDQLLIRTQYFSDGLETTISDISMDSAIFTNVGLGQAAYVEQCDCPVGYSGSSCESCSDGFKHQPGSWLGTCEGPVKCPPMYYKDPRDNRCKPCSCPHTDSPQFGTGCHLDYDSNITCDCPPGYEGRNCEKCSYPLYDGNPLLNQPCIRRRVPDCDPAGSLSTQLDPYTGRCTCKEYATGRTCNQCKPNTFNLASGNQYGCINCFCMGINTTCTSSDLYRTQIASAFTRDNQGFKLAEANRLSSPITDIQVNPSAQEIYFQQFNPGVYYWVLPSKFLHNKVTSYGGYLKYTFRYMPTPGGQSSPNNAPDVELVSNSGVHLVYYNRNQPLPEANRPVTVVVPLLEQHWERVDGEKANREHLMMSLAELDNILIKATYTTNTQEAALLSVSLDTATTERNTGQNRAVEVELCQCPVGYRGTSCEECDAGYTRIEEGLYLGTCEPCNCNGYSSECDPETGSCMNCRGYTRGDHCEQCIEGFRGTPAAGVPCSPDFDGCTCDPRGSISSNCDRNQLCPCKTNVVGQSCNECRPGTFDLSQSNLDGCIECYCSGVSNECQSSNLYREAIPMQIIDETHQFTLTDKSRNVVIRDGFLLNPSKNEIGYDFSSLRQQLLFWSLPPEFTGNKVLSYGGNLNFTKTYTSLPNPPQSFDTDVVIVSPTMTLFWVDEDFFLPDTTKVTSIPLKENNWRRLDSSQGQRLASRADIMKVLSNIQAILIRAKHSIYTQISYLSDVSLDTAVSQRTSSQQVAAEVEVCRCPPGYRGTSCETCSAGYYQDFDSTCKKCPCNSNEEHCALGPQQQVICTCKSPYGGTYCDRIVNEDTPRPTPGSPTISISISEPTVIVIEAGRDINFTCTGRSLLSSKPVVLEWSKENGYLPQGRAYDNRQGVLLIRDVQAYDAGTYICTASDGFTFVTEKALLNVGGSAVRPVVTVSPRSLEVREGEPVEFRCEATGVPQPALQWINERSNRLPPQSSFASGVFRIPYASLQDEGSFTCIARNTAGEDSGTVYLYVRSAPPTAPPLPQVRLSIQPPDYSGIAEENVRLECVASNPRNIRLQWSRQDGALSSTARDLDGKLLIYNSQPEDSGIYTCTAIDQNSGSVLQEVRIRVNISPPQRPQPTISIDPSRQTVPQGSLAELRCFSPEGPVQWSKAGDTLPSNAKVDGSILRIENIQVRDRGVYMCEVRGPGGTSRSQSVVEVERREMPAIELIPQGSQTITEGGSVMFECRVLQGIPSPTLHWSRVDGTPLSQHVEQLPAGVLRFNSVSRADEGQYLCTADNQEGSATTVADLKVLSMPVITITPPGQTIKVSAGQRVRLDCRATGYPEPTVFWSKHQQGYSFYEPKSITQETPQGSVHEIKGATVEDEGSYTCTARNAAGDKEERIQLIISDDQTPSGPSRGDIPSPSSGVYIPNDDFVIPLGGNVTIRCINQGSNRINLQWVRRDQRPLSYLADVREGTLYFNRVQYADAGEYSCQGVGSRGEILFSANAHLRVIEPSQIKLEPQRQVVRPGDNARITCTATGEQPIVISWHSANGQPLPRSVRVSGGVIEFMGIHVNNAGRYICRAQNPQGILESSADVIVNDNQGSFVTAVDRNPSAIEGSSVKLHCKSSEYRDITWRRENQPLPQRATIEGSSLRIDNLQLEDSGRYICSINTNGYTTEDYINVTVEPNPCTLDEFNCRNRECVPLLRVCDGKPDCRDGSDESSCEFRPGPGRNDMELQIQPSKREVHYGDTLDLKCMVTAGPSYDMRIYWSRPDGSTLPANARSAGDILRINTATPENTGTYRCTAISRSNRVDKDYSLTVYDDRPTHNATSAETVKVQYGQTVELDCEIDLEGHITHDWTKHGGVLPANSQKSGPRLTISSVTYKDAGLYICTADNGNTQSDIPKIILVEGAVPFFAQAPYSYLALPTLSNSYTKFNIEITFKPENPDGLILYNGKNNEDFISFGLRDGLPEFRFDVGSGPGIIKGSEPLTMGTWHTVILNRNKKQGIMYVDEGQYYTNSSRGRMQGLDLLHPLYLGGVPDFSAINKQNGFESGFVGCISRLVINNKEEIDIMNEQKESEGVTSCETCAVNPCINSGVCQEAPTRTGYTCLCPRGFSGLNCSHLGEPCYQGACGDGRCLDSDEGLECLCGLGKTGDRCERDVSITEPSFSKNSYLAYPSPKRLDKIKVYVKFNPADYSNGLLLYCAENEDGAGDFLSIYIKDRHVEFTFSAGTGITTLRSTNEVAPGQWMTVNAGVTSRQATLSLTGESLPVSKEFRSAVLKFTTPLYVGGYDKQRIKPAGGVSVRQGFNGCVTEVYISSLSLDLIRSVVDSANIQQCSARHEDPCQLRPCQNNGACYPGPDGRSYQCSCPTGFSGENCEVEQDMCAALQPCQNGGVCVATSTSYKCKCPTGLAGLNCEERATFKREVNFNGDGYVELSKSLMPHTDPDEPEVIHIEFSTKQPNGILLWHGQTEEMDGFGQDYMSLAVVNGHLQLSYELGSSSPARIVTSSRVDDGTRHAAVIKRQGKDGSIELDREDIEFGECEGLLVQLNTEGNIYIGGLPNIDLMASSHGNYTGFVGCIHSLQIQNSGIINFAEQAVSSVNTQPCPSSTTEDDDYDDGRGEVVN